MTEKLDAIIKRIQEKQLALEKGMDDSLPRVFRDLSNQVIDMAADYPLNAADRAERIRAIIDFKRTVTAAVANNPEYIEQVALLTEGFADLKTLSDQYFSELIDNYNAKDELYREILRANIDLTRSNLLGAGIQENFGNAITEVLKANASGTTSRAQLNTIMRQFITGTDTQKAYLERYVKQTTQDAVMTFSREYNDTVAADLNLQYYFYQGSLIQDSRPFCKARAGRYYKKSEVQSWAKLGNWDGRKPGTNAVTIFTYAGGYGCRHELYPVTKTIYELAKKRGAAGMR